MNEIDNNVAEYIRKKAEGFNHMVTEFNNAVAKHGFVYAAEWFMEEAVEGAIFIQFYEHMVYLVQSQGIGGLKQYLNRFEQELVRYRYLKHSTSPASNMVDVIRLKVEFDLVRFGIPEILAMIAEEEAESKSVLTIK